MAPQRPHYFAPRPKNSRRRLNTFCAPAQHIPDSPWFAHPPTKGGSLRAKRASVGSHQSADDRPKKIAMKISSINGAPEEPVSHNPAAKKQVWFRKGDLPPFTQIARVVVPPGEILTAHVHADMHELFIILEGTACLIVDDKAHDLKSGDAIALAPSETHELSNPSNEPLVFIVAGWTNSSRASNT